MKILALDLATKTGWAWFVDDKVSRSGVWYLNPKGADKSRFYSLMVNLEHHCKYTGIPDICGYEQPGRLFGHAKKILPGLQAIVEVWADSWNVPVITVSPTTIKKFATGNGRSDKEKMMEAAGERWPSILLQTNDQADALWLGEYVRETQ